MRTILVLAVMVAFASPDAAMAAEDTRHMNAIAVVPDDLGLDLDHVPGGREQLLCLALNDYWEARGERLRGRVAVAKVVLNRVRDSRYPASVCDVVSQNRTQTSKACQFSWHCDGLPDTPADLNSWRSSLMLAAAVLYAGWQIDDPSGGALWYHAASVAPDWADSLDRSAVIGQHIFYREPGESPPHFNYLGRPPLTDPQVAALH